MSAKFKIFLILLLSIFATVTAGSILTKRQLNTAISTNQNVQAQQPHVAIQTTNLAINPERAKYKTIPLDSIKSGLQGSDPASLAMDAFDTYNSDIPGALSSAHRSKRKVEVVYPYSNQALVTITQNVAARNYRTAVRYRVELTSFGRTILASSPPMWEIVWVGSQEQK
ncbi:MAG: hypothetical protein HC785_01220 [Calothrix sp. CSU_2_0]|nr:hypothetical protein [Calothrix sp. CSU_2_0]